MPDRDQQIVRWYGEAEEISAEDLKATSDMYERLRDGTFYEDHENARRELLRGRPE